MKNWDELSFDFNSTGGENLRRYYKDGKWSAPEYTTSEYIPVHMCSACLNYGLQASQFTACSTTAECQTLSNPMYVHSIPNNNDNQDIVSMGTNSALIARRVIDNSFQVIAIHFMAIVQAVDALGFADKLSPLTNRVYKDIRAFFPRFEDDTPKYKDIEKMIIFLKEQSY